MAEHEEMAKLSQPCPNHYTHSFQFPELRLETGSNEQPYFRALLFFSKKPGLSDEFFHEHWKSVHADLTMQTPDVGVDLVRYVQFHMEPRHREEIQPLLQNDLANIHLVNWDGCAEFHAKSARHFMNFMTSVYASSRLVGCGKRFADLTSGYHIMCGYDNLIFGQSLPASTQRHGILPGDSRLNYSERAIFGGPEADIMCTKQNTLISREEPAKLAQEGGPSENRILS